MRNLQLFVTRIDLSTNDRVPATLNLPLNLCARTRQKCRELVFTYRTMEDRVYAIKLL